MQNSKNLGLKWAIFLCIVIAAVFDLFTTLRNNNALVLETNPIFMLIGHEFSVYLVKIVGMAVFAWVIFVSLDKLKWDWYKFVMIYFLILAIFLQLFASYSNHRNISGIAANENKSISELTKEDFSKYIPPESEKLRFYWLFLLSSLSPILIALCSFIIWEKMYYVNRLD